MFIKHGSYILSFRGVKVVLGEPGSNLTAFLLLLLLLLLSRELAQPVSSLLSNFPSAFYVTHKIPLTVEAEAILVYNNG